MMTGNVKQLTVAFIVLTAKEKFLRFFIKLNG